MSKSTLWNDRHLFAKPRVFPAAGFEAPGVKALFYEGEPWQGKPTRVFGWLGIPEKTRRNGKCPAMVLVHGGGATALADWVRMWTARGYVALSMDTCGGVPVWNESPYYRIGGWPRHAHSGPAGWGLYEKSRLPVGEQWMYHAVAAVLRGHSLLRSLPEVDPARIGVTGVSWGGVLTCVAAGVDPRFRFAAPVYGCGFLKGADSVLWTPGVLPAAIVDRWFKLWDPGRFLPQSKMPVLWLNGTNDFAFPMDAFRRSYRAARGPRTLCIPVRMVHAHGGAGENIKELFRFADIQCRGAVPFPQVGGTVAKGNLATVTWTPAAPIVRAEFNFTRASGYWPDRTWTTVPAELDAAMGRASATIPHACTCCYFNLFDADGCLISSEHAEVRS
jgi:dienelactone hydrolase